MSRLSITSQTEKAFAAYFNAKKSGVLATVNGYEGQSGIPGEEVKLPSAIFIASEPSQVTYDVQIFEIKLTVKIETSLDTSPTNIQGDMHHKRVSAMRDMIENFQVLYAAVNHPLPPATDTRAVRDYTLSCCYYEGEGQGEEDRRIITDLNYNVVASAIDEMPIEG